MKNGNKIIIKFCGGWKVGVGWGGGKVDDVSSAVG